MQEKHTHPKEELRRNKLMSVREPIHTSKGASGIKPGNLPIRETLKVSKNDTGNLSTEYPNIEPSIIPRIIPDIDPTKEPTTHPGFVDPSKDPNGFPRDMSSVSSSG